MKTIGLTGSIGMGKSTTAGFFKEAGIPVFDADAVVHDLYTHDGEAIAEIAEQFPGAVRDGVVDRKSLSDILREDPGKFQTLEAIIHPRVAARRRQAIKAVQNTGTAMIVFDIPLLFETGQAEAYDVILVVTADPEIQAQRVLARPGMTPTKFRTILDRQMPDADKRDRADFIIDTSNGLDDARQQVLDIIDRLNEPAKQPTQSPDA